VIASRGGKNKKKKCGSLKKMTKKKEQNGKMLTCQFTFFPLFERFRFRH